MRIKKIIMYRDNGMYKDCYDVVYCDAQGVETWKRYTVRGVMCNKHFDFIMTHKCAPHYRKNNGYHNYDIFA